MPRAGGRGENLHAEGRRQSREPPCRGPAAGAQCGYFIGRSFSGVPKCLSETKVGGSMVLLNRVGGSWGGPYTSFLLLDIILAS